MQRLLDSARGTTPPPKTTARFNLNLSSFKKTIGSLIDKQTVSTDSAKEDGNVGLAVNLKTSLDKLKTYIRAIDFLNGTLGLLAVVCLLGAVVITYQRRRLLIVISIALITIALLQLIGLKVVRPTILNQLQNNAYRPAAGVVYDTLLATFRRSATVAAIIGLVLFLIAFLTKPSLIKRNKYLTNQIAHFKKTSFGLWVKTFRGQVRQYRWQISLAVVLLGLAAMAFFVNGLNWQTIIRSVLFIIAGVELTYLVAARARKVPM